MGEDYGGHGPSHIRYFILSATSSSNSLYTFFAHSFLGNICVGLAPGHFDGGDHASSGGKDQEEIDEEDDSHADPPEAKELMQVSEVGICTPWPCLKCLVAC